MAYAVETPITFTKTRPPQARGRGALSNASGRYERLQRVALDEEACSPALTRLAPAPWISAPLVSHEPLRTTVSNERAKRIITTNASPDIAFDQSINPYRGCEHGCIYCYARPTHTYMGLSAGLDFETRLFAKRDAAKLLERELSRPSYTPKVIALGANTDPYQPIEKRYEITRSILQVLSKFNHPVAVITKSHLVTRDLDILAPMAERGLVKVCLSVTTLEPKLARAMEPRAATPERRLAALAELHGAGVPAGVMVAPIVPALNDAEIETILERAAEAGAAQAGYVLLRLPLEIKQLFTEWLENTVPNRAQHIIRVLKEMRGGKAYDAAWGTRMRGKGPYADMISKRFRKGLERFGLNQARLSLDLTQFSPPPKPGDQLKLF